MNEEVIYKIASNRVKDGLIDGGWLKDFHYISSEDLIIFLSLDKSGNILSFAALINSEVVPYGLEVIKYTEMRDDLDNEVGLGLVKFAMEEGKKAGCKFFYALVPIGSKSENIAKILGLSPASHTVYAMECDLGHFANSDFEKIYNSDLPELSNIIKINDYNDRLLQRVIKNYDVTGFFVYPKAFDPDCSRFYIEDGEIRAGLCMKFYNKSILKSIRLYQSPKLKSKRAMACILAVLINEVRDLIADAEKIILYISYQKIYESIKQYFPGETKEMSYKFYYKEL